MTQTPVLEPSRSNFSATFRALREAEFPWTGETIYLNNASTGPIPERTRRVIDAFTAKRTAPHQCPDRELLAVLGEARVLLARLINAETAEIALGPNTSFGLTLAALALPLDPGDTVLVSHREFPANVYPWLMLQQRGIRVEMIPTTREGWPDECRILERLRDPRVRALSISFVQFSNGYRADLATLGAACRDHGAWLVVDGIQGIGHESFDVRRLPIDIMACGGQKWLLSPWGSGFVYVRRDLQPLLRSPFGGWMSFEGTDDFSRLTEYNPTPRSDARRYELGTLAYQDFVGMIESVRLLLEIGVDTIADYTRQLREPLVRLASEGRIRLTSPTDAVHDSSIVCATTDHVVEGFHALKKARVVCSLREGTIRLSPHFYNTVEEMEKVAGILAGH